MTTRLSLAAGALLAATALLVAGGANADGDAAEDMPSLGGSGTIQPLEETRIRLVSVRLHLELVGGYLWRASAEYRLENPGPPRAIRFGVPITWRRFQFLGDPPSAPDTIEEGAKEIAITLLGRRIPCAPILADTAARTAPPQVEAWCVANLTVPTGRAIPLTLEFEGFAQEGGRPGFAANVARTTYTLAPAGFWRGRVREVSIVIDPGPLAGHLKLISPPDARQVNGTIRWDGSDVDLQHLPSLIIDADADVDARRPRPRQGRATEGTWLRESVPLTATASSTLAPQGKHGYGAGKAVDGDRATAWCEGAKGDGVGESLSVTAALPSGSDRECRIFDVELVPGLASDDATYRANGRVAAGRIERCDDPGRAFLFRLAASAFDPNVSPRLRDDDHAGDPPVEIAIPPGALGDDVRCVKLVVTEVRRGTRYPDTCVSELIPRVFCRTQPAAGGALKGE